MEPVTRLDPNPCLSTSAFRSLSMDDESGRPAVQVAGQTRSVPYEPTKMVTAHRLRRAERDRIAGFR